MFLKMSFFNLKWSNPSVGWIVVRLWASCPSLFLIPDWSYMLWHDAVRLVLIAPLNYWLNSIIFFWCSKPLYVKNWQNQKTTLIMKMNQRIKTTSKMRANTTVNTPKCCRVILSVLLWYHGGLCVYLYSSLELHFQCFFRHCDYSSQTRLGSMNTCLWCLVNT